MRLLLDTSIIGKLCHPKCDPDLTRWLSGLLADQGEHVTLIVPEIADYELRRELIRGIARGQIDPLSLQRLDELAEDMDYQALNTAAFRDAAQLWANARIRGLPTADNKALDGDVLLAAQARAAGRDAVVITENRRHLTVYGVEAKDWRDTA